MKWSQLRGDTECFERPFPVRESRSGAALRQVTAAPGRAVRRHTQW